MKKIVFVLLFVFSLGAMKAQNLNEYKYIIVPESFEFSDSPNEYELNELTKFLFEKYGFEALMKKDDRPSDLRENHCLGLEADVKDNSGLFVTKLSVVLEDCEGRVVFESKEGRSREKDFKVARHEALRDAFTSIEALNYEYDADPVVETTGDTQEDPEPVEEPEVAAEVPEEQNREQALGKEVQEAGENNLLENILNKTYKRNNAEFHLQENEEGFALTREGMDEPFAMLIRSEKEGNFIYNSLSRQGMAYFDAEGNLVVEYFDREENKTIKSVYQLQD